MEKVGCRYEFYFSFWPGRFTTTCRLLLLLRASALILHAIVLFLGMLLHVFTMGHTPTADWRGE